MGKGVDGDALCCLALGLVFAVILVVGKGHVVFDGALGCLVPLRDDAS